MVGYTAWMPPQARCSGPLKPKAKSAAGANFHGANVLIGSQDGALYCVDAKSGKSLWKFSIENQIRCTPTVVENRAFVAGCDGQLHIVDVTKGQSLGQVDIQAPTGVTPAVMGDHVFFGTEGGPVLLRGLETCGGGLDV